MPTETYGLDKAEQLVKRTLDDRISQLERLIQRTMMFTDERLLWLRPEDTDMSKKEKEQGRFGIRMTERVKQALVQDFGEELQLFNDMRDEIFNDEGDSE